MQEFLGRGVLHELSALISGRVLLLIQQGNLNRFGDVLLPLTAHTALTIYTDIQPNPCLKSIERAIATLGSSAYDCMIACGGGSTIDFAKALRYHAGIGIPLLAVPTTAGSGSEATQFAAIYHDRSKYSLDDPQLLPDAAICDSTFTEQAPRYLKACTAMDAYCQAIESYWARLATAQSRAYALQAITLCSSCLISAINSSEAWAHEQMMRAAHLAGKAINISRTTAAHALSYAITSGYGIPHGHAVALSIGALFELNIHATACPGLLLQAMGISPGEARQHFSRLMTSIGLEHDIRQLGIADTVAVIKNINLQRLANNPRELSESELMTLLQ